MVKGKLPELGKVDLHFFQEVIYPHLGAKDPTVILGPTHGVDFGVVDLGDKVMVTSADPVYIAPALGWERAAWFALHILASDVAVSGIRPRYLSIDLNLPPEMDEDVLRIIWHTLHREAEKLGIAIVSGHTARYAGCTYPMVGGATVIGVDDRRKLVDPRSVRPGDLVIVTKGPAIETTGLMSVQFPEFIEERFGPVAVKEAQGIFYQMTVVHDCAILSEVGGVHAMHDATECGVWGALSEMAEAGGWGLRVWPERIVVQEIVSKTCEVFDIDPFKAISEGTLVAVVSPPKAEEAVEALQREGIQASVVGEVIPREEGTWLVYRDRKEPLLHPKVDPFWLRFEEYLQKQRQRMA